MQIAVEFMMIYANPDDFLGDPRVFTDERNQEAWRACKDLVERTLMEAREEHNYYLVCGVQGSGKTWWVKENRASFAEPAIVFDAAFPRARDRAGAVAQARRFSCRLICIWISCPLDVALARNRARPPDQVVPDEVVRLVFNNFEPPNLQRGVRRSVRDRERLKVAKPFHNGGLGPAATVGRKPAVRPQMSGFQVRYGRSWAKQPLRRVA